MATEAEINKILCDMRCALDEGKYTPVDRRKNMNTLAFLGYTWEDAKNELYQLKPKHYRQGPVIDRDFPSSDLLWIFKVSLEGNVIYIKFKVEYQLDGTVKLLSFHLDEV